MKPSNIFAAAGKFLVLVILYIVVFSASGQFFVDEALRAQMSSGDQGAALMGSLVVAVIDVGVLLGILLTSRLHGGGLWLNTALVMYGAKTFTSMLESWYFMRNVRAELLPGLFMMTLPLLLLMPAVAMLLFGRWKPGRDPDPAPWHLPKMTSTEWFLKVLFLSVVVYPVLFLAFGYFVAWQSAEVRQFYGSSELLGPVDHMLGVVSSDPWMLVLECARGALWVVLAAALIWTTRGSGWLGGVWALLVFSLVQNNVHILPNPFMPPEVQYYHFIETASSNAINAILITWLMRRSHRPAGSPASALGGVQRPA